jgi:hypothetical protein
MSSIEDSCIQCSTVSTESMPMSSVGGEYLCKKCYIRAAHDVAWQITVKGAESPVPSKCFGCRQTEPCKVYDGMAACVKCQKRECVLNDTAFKWWLDNMAEGCGCPMCDREVDSSMGREERTDKSLVPSPCKKDDAGKTLPWLPMAGVFANIR